MKNILVLRCPYVVQKSWTTVTWFANITRVVTRINENTSHSSTMTFVALFWPGASYIKEDERQTSRQYAITAWMKVWDRRSVSPQPLQSQNDFLSKSRLFSFWEATAHSVIFRAQYNLCAVGLIQGQFS